MLSIFVTKAVGGLLPNLQGGREVGLHHHLPGWSAATGILSADPGG